MHKGRWSCGECDPDGAPRCPTSGTSFPWRTVNIVSPFGLRGAHQACPHPRSDRFRMGWAAPGRARRDARWDARGLSGVQAGGGQVGGRGSGGKVSGRTSPLTPAVLPALPLGPAAADGGCRRSRAGVWHARRHAGPVDHGDRPIRHTVRGGTAASGPAHSPEDRRNQERRGPEHRSQGRHSENSSRRAHSGEEGSGEEGTGERSAGAKDRSRQNHPAQDLRPQDDRERHRDRPHPRP